MFEIDRQGSWVVVHPVGELDLAVVDQFRAAVLEAVNRSGRVAIDFSDVAFVDS